MLFRSEKEEYFNESQPLRPEPSPIKTASASQKELKKEEFQVMPGELNLAHIFPEGEDTTDISKSYAGKAFVLLMEQEEEWLDNIYHYADMTPEQFASRLGRPKRKVIGTYNPNDELHDPDNPDSWVIPSFHNIRTNVVNGDGRPVSLYSNVIEIMSAANVYTYYKNAKIGRASCRERVF